MTNETALRELLHGLRRREVQAIGAAISNQSWHGVEQAYNSLRDKMDRAGAWHEPTKSPSQPVEEPTAKGDRVAGLMRERFEAHKHEKWDGFTADNLMIRLLNIALREYRLVEPSQPVVAEAPPADVVALVIAARQIMDRGYVSTSIEEERDDAEALDRALERFSSRVCYDDEGGSLADAHASPCTCGLAQSPSQPVVQGGRVTQADWDKAVDSLEANAGTVFSKIDHALSAHSQTDTQEGDSVAFLATTEAMDDVKSHRSAWRIWSGTERRTIWTGPTRAAGEAWAAQNGIVIDQVEHFEP